MSEIKEQIVERLRAEAAYLSGRGIDRGCVDSGIASNLAFEAADRIEALEKEISISDAEGNHAYALAVDDPGKNPPVLWREVAATLTARIKVLEEALRPFAQEADHYEPDEGDDKNVAWCSDFSIGSLRAARLALNATPQDGKGGEEW